MAIKREKVGEHNGKDIYEYTLNNDKELSVIIFNYGGIIKSLIYKGIDVVLGRDTIDEYLRNTGFFGAIIGRNSNRIENAEVEINGKVYKLHENNGRNNFHGGIEGFDKKVWDAEIIEEDEPSLVLTYISPDGEEGFPGQLNVKVTYTLTSNNSLRIHYESESNADTILNMTNHSYFNLNGHSSGTINGHSLWINSDFFTPNTYEYLPSGEIIRVKGTPFDFTSEKILGKLFSSEYEQIRMFNGFDHNFVLNERGFRKVACFKGDTSEILMEIYTDRPGMQLYTKNFEDSQRMCKDGSFYPRHAAACFETQTFPNSLKFSHFTDSVLRKGEKYDTVTEYRFI